MRDEEQAPKRASKKDHIAQLLTAVKRWVEEGLSPEDAISNLSQSQYDLLIDHDIDFDNLLLTSEQLADLEKIRREPRPTFPKGYNKKYPKEKQDLYSNIIHFLQEKGAIIQKREKENFRDLDFTLNGTLYKIVLSNPRKKS